VFLFPFTAAPNSILNEINFITHKIPNSPICERTTPNSLFSFCLCLTQVYCSLKSESWKCKIPLCTFPAVNDVVETSKPGMPWLIVVQVLIYHDVQTWQTHVSVDGMAVNGRLGFKIPIMEEIKILALQIYYLQISHPWCFILFEWLASLEAH